VSRTRSEYRRDLSAPPPTPTGRPGPHAVVPAAEAGRDALAALLLDAYRGTIDDDGEGEDDARAAIDHYLGQLVPPYSVIVELDGRPVSLSFVVLVQGRHYIDPVATSAAHKRQGLGVEAVGTSLRRLNRDGVDEVGAVITDGNLASERLFARLGFRRVGPWG
jgi:GNAT superfamily N-acetyltransferase